MESLDLFLASHSFPAIHARTPLYGGALSISLPQNLVDASDFRQIPDHQEVFVDSTPFDSALIIELLECSVWPSLARSGAFFFSQLAQENSSVESSLVHRWLTDPVQLACSLPSLPFSVAVGTQKIPKYRSAGQLIDALILLAVCVLPEPHSAGILVTLTLPLCCPLPEPPRDHPLAAYFVRLVMSLQICDLSLFNVNSSE